MRLQEGIDAAWSCHKRAWTIYWSCWPCCICGVVLGLLDADRNGPLALAGGMLLLVGLLTFLGFKIHLWLICSRENQHTLASLVLLMAPYLVFVILWPWLVVLHLLGAF